MKKWYTRPVFFVSDGELALDFYQNKLGFSLDWNYRENEKSYVCQVSRQGTELILAENEAKAGQGRVFISLDESQEKALRKEIEDNEIEARDLFWGMPVIEIVDLDKNELLFSPPTEL